MENCPLVRDDDLGPATEFHQGICRGRVYRGTGYIAPSRIRKLNSGGSMGKLPLGLFLVLKLCRARHKIM